MSSPIARCFLADRRAVVALAVLASGACAGCTKEPDWGPAVTGFPAYNLHVGQELSYAGESTYEYGDKDDRRTMDDWSDWTIWVARQNDDGTWRLIIRYVTGREERSMDADDADVTLAYIDLAPDGSFEDNASFGFSLNPHTLFAKLPDNEQQLAEGWQTHSPLTGETYRYSTSDVVSGPSAKWTFQRDADGIQNRVYQWQTESQVEFARSRGVVGRITTRTSQEWGIKGEGVSSTTLKKIDERDQAWIETLDTEFERYREASQQYDALTGKLEHSLDDVEARLAQARQVWVDLASDLQNDEVRAAVEKRIAAHDGGARYQVEEARRLAAKLGKPAADWDTVDLAGEPRKLTDDRGKVMVLDFWYRGCGWCIRAMPQIKELVDDFADEDVVVLGMNIDEELEDALFVEEALQLNYPSVRIDKELPEKYGVRGFPTLVVVDREGTIRDFHVGYSPRLREEVRESVRELLAEAG